MEQTECIPEHAATHCSTCDKPFSSDGLSHSLKSDLGGGRCSSCGKPEYAEHVRRNISPLHARNQTNAPLSRSLSPALRSSNLDLETENAKLSEMLARLSVARNATNKLMDDMRNSRRRSLDAKISTGVDRADTPRIPLAKRLALAKAEYAHLENVKRSENQASTILEAHASAEKLDQELLDARKEARAIRTENLIREKEITRMVNYPRDVGAIQEQLQRELAAIRARNANLRKSIEMSRSMRQTKRDLVPSPRARVRLTLSPTHAGDTALDMTVPEHNDDPLPETANDQSSESSETVVVKSSAPEEPEEVVMDATSTIVAELTSPYVEKEENTAVDPVFATLVETTQKRVEMPSPAVSTSPPNLVPVSREVSRGSSTVMLHSSNSNTHWIVSDILRMTTPPANEGDDGHLVEEDVKRPVVVPYFIQQRGEFFDSRVFNIHWVHSPLGTNARLSPCEGDLPGSIYTTPVGETLAIVPVVELGPLATIHEVSPEAGEQSSSVARYTSAHEEIDSDLRRLSDFSSEEATVPSLYGDGIVCDIPNKQSLNSTLFPQASSGDLAMDKVHDTPSTVPIVLDMPDATQTPSGHSTTSYNLPADASDIMAALALEREKTESICGGGIVCDVPNKQSLSSTLFPQACSGDLAMDKVHDTPSTVPIVLDVPDATQTPSAHSTTSYNLPADAVDIMAALALEREKTESICGGGIVCDVPNKQSVSSTLFPQASSGDLAMDKVHDTPSTVPVVLDIPDATQTPSAHSTTSYNLPADALDIMAALALEREKTESICGGGIVCDVPNKQSLSSTLFPQARSGDLAMDKVHDTPSTVPVVSDIPDATQTPSAHSTTSYNLPADALDIMAALALEREKTESICGGGIVCDIPNKQSLSSTLFPQASSGDLAMDKVHDTPSTVPVVLDIPDATQTPSAHSATSYNLPADALDIMAALALEREKTESICGGGIVCDVPNKQSLGSTLFPQASSGDLAMDKVHDTPSTVPVVLDIPDATQTPLAHSATSYNLPADALDIMAALALEREKTESICGGGIVCDVPNKQSLSSTLFPQASSGDLAMDKVHDTPSTVPVVLDIPDATQTPSAHSATSYNLPADALDIMAALALEREKTVSICGGGIVCDVPNKQSVSSTLFPQASSGDLAIDKVHDTPSTVPIVLEIPDVTQTPSAHSTTSYNLPADALDIMAALALEREKTESICGGGIVCDVPNKQSLSSTLFPQASSGDLAMDEVHDTPSTVPIVLDIPDATKTPSAHSTTSYNLPADALDIMAAVALQREKTESICGGGIVCDVPNKQSLCSTLFPQASSGDLAMDKVHDTPSTVPVVLDIPDATQTPSAHSTTSYNLPADALDIMAALALEREKTESICGGGIVCDVPNKQSLSSTLFPQASSGDLAMDKVHDTPSTVPVVLDIPDATQTPSAHSATSYNLPADALDIMAALALEREKTESICGGGIVCDVPNKQSLSSTLFPQASSGDLAMDKVHDTPSTLPVVLDIPDATQTPSAHSATSYNLPADALDIMAALALEREKTESICGGGIVCDVPNKQSLSSTLFPQASSGDLGMDKVHDTPSTVPVVLDIPDATQTPSAHSTTYYNLPADALDIMAALALEREKTESICGGGIVCDVPNKQSVSSTLLPQTSNGDRAIDKVHDTPFMLPVVPEITEPLEKTDHPGSMASEALDILAAAAAEMDDSDALKDSSLTDLVVDETDLHLRDTVIVDSAPLSPIHQSDQSQSVTLVASAEDSTVVVSCKLCDTTTQILPDTYLSYSYTGESVPETVFELSAMPLNETMRESMPGSASITMCEGDYPESDEQLEPADPVHSSTILEEPEITAQFESQMISIISVEEIAGTRNASLLMEPVTDRENRQPTNVESELGLPEIQNLSSLNDSVELEHSSEFIPKQLFQSDVVSNETSELGERSKDPTPSPVPHPAPIPVFMKSSLEKSPKFFPH